MGGRGGGRRVEDEAGAETRPRTMELKLQTQETKERRKRRGGGGGVEDEKKVEKINKG